MRWFPQWLCLMLIGMIALSSLLLTTCTTDLASPTVTPADVQATAALPTGKPSVPLEMDLSFTTLPLLDQSAQLVLRVRPLIDSPDTTVQITLPEGFELVDGSLVWQGSMSANDTRELKVRVRPTQSGLWTITAGAKSQLPGSATFRREVGLPVNIGGREPIDGVPPQSHETPSTQSTAEDLGKPAAPIEMDLSFSALPLLDQVVTLTFWVRPLIDAPSTTAQITLAEGFELVGGGLTWQGDLAADEARDIQVEVKAVETGFWTIIAESVTHLPGGAQFGRSIRLYVDVTEEGVTVSKDAKHP